MLPGGVWEQWCTHLLYLPAWRRITLPITSLFSHCSQEC
jgi:hypothetical protein